MKNIDILISQGDDETANVLLQDDGGNGYMLNATLATDPVELDLTIFRGDEEGLVSFAVEIIAAALKLDSWVDEEWVRRLLREKIPGFGRRGKK